MTTTQINIDGQYLWVAATDDRRIGYPLYWHTTEIVAALRERGLPDMSVEVEQRIAGWREAQRAVTIAAAERAATKARAAAAAEEKRADLARDKSERLIALRRFRECRHTLAVWGPHRVYTAPVAGADEDPRAHGGVSQTQNCPACGGARERNSNGRYEELGSWYMAGPADLYRRRGIEER